MARRTLLNYNWEGLSSVSTPDDQLVIELTDEEENELIRRIEANEIPESSGLHGMHVTNLILLSGQKDIGEGYIYPFVVKILSPDGLSDRYPATSALKTEWARVMVVSSTSPPSNSEVLEMFTPHNEYTDEEIEALAEQYLSNEFQPLETGETLEHRMGFGPPITTQSGEVNYSIKHPLYLPFRVHGGPWDPGNWWYRCTSYVPLPVETTYLSSTGTLVTYESIKSKVTQDQGFYLEGYFPYDPSNLGFASVPKPVAQRVHERILYSIGQHSPNGPDITNGISADSILNQFVYLKPTEVPGWQFPEVLMYGGETELGGGNPRDLNWWNQRFVRTFMDSEIGLALLTGTVLCDTPENPEDWVLPCKIEIPGYGIFNLRDPTNYWAYSWRGSWWLPQGFRQKAAVEYWMENGYVLVKKDDMVAMGYATRDPVTDEFAMADLSSVDPSVYKMPSWDLLHPMPVDLSVLQSFVTYDEDGEFVSYDHAGYAASAEGQALQAWVTAAQAANAGVDTIMNGDHSIQALEELVEHTPSPTPNQDIGVWMVSNELDTEFTVVPSDGSDPYTDYANAKQIWSDLFGYSDVWPSNRPTSYSASDSNSTKYDQLVVIMSYLKASHPEYGHVYHWNDTQTDFVKRSLVGVNYVRDTYHDTTSPWAFSASTTWASSPVAFSIPGITVPNANVTRMLTKGEMDDSFVGDALNAPLVDVTGYSWYDVDGMYVYFKLDSVNDTYSKMFVAKSTVTGHAGRTNGWHDSTGFSYASASADDSWHMTDYSVLGFMIRMIPQAVLSDGTVVTGTVTDAFAS